ncbi:MAG: DUF2723 domain-containing protein [Bacteroidales bacterium]|nr:DUF2723 domain-containing protein [Bacteroidales bacterium]
MKKYSSLNNLVGWIVFLIAGYTYLTTIESTASFWDCGEFIAASYKLEVGHPPGAPLFLLVGRLFSLFVGDDTQSVALAINALSGLASAFTILFLFWTITHLIRKSFAQEDEPDFAQRIVIIGSGIVGALAYTFSDTFWFSAVEGEVYASSSLFTAVVFWAILKWENIADEKYANRWLILIAYLMGLSIGVHLLNLLAIPAIVLIYFFKKFQPTRTGIISVIVIMAIILGGLMYVIIPGTVKFASVFERVIVNSTGLPYFSGVFIYLIILTGLLIFGISYTHKLKKYIANTIILAVTVILIGYSSYALIVIRSQANPPMDQNNPEHLFSLLSYLNREQYGDRPLIYGQYLNAPGRNAGKGKPVYAPVDGKYKIINYKPVYKYDSKYNTFFPRMYSQQPEHIEAYTRWTGLDESDLFEVRLNREGEPVRDRYGDIVYDYSSPKNPPGFNKNIRFFIRYQLGHMYFRYFMWNYSGRQNDIQSHYKEEINKGNWISGINFLDAARIGNQEKLPDKLKNNKAHNKYYMLPLILGLLGMFFQYRKDKKNFWVVLSLFFFTGIAIVVYLNQYPIQPRERDYAYAGSFYAFAIWIGMSVAGLYQSAKNSDMKSLSRFITRGLISLAVIALLDFISNGTLTFTISAIYVMLIISLLLALMKIIGGTVRDKQVIAVIALLITVLVPILMAVENWDDHDRSGRYLARDFASNYLNSCEKNAILFTNGDNDTFPLWYAQEVEGIRTDVRVINLSYLSADWYIEQMERKAYDSDPIKMTLKKEDYIQVERDIVYLQDRVKGYIDLKEAIDFITHDEALLKSIPGIPEGIYFIPQHKFRLNADSVKVFNNGTIKPNMADKYQNPIRWEIKQGYLTKNHLMVLDFLATNDWERPIYYAITVGNENYLDLDNFFESHGLAYRIIPAYVDPGFGSMGEMNTDVVFDNMMNKFKWGGIEEKDLYLEENSLRMLANFRHNFIALASALIEEGKKDSAILAQNRCMEIIPNEIVPFDFYMLGIVENYYALNQQKQAQEIADIILENTLQDVDYLLSLRMDQWQNLQFERQVAQYVIKELLRYSTSYNDKFYSAKIQQQLENYGDAITFLFK